MQLRNCICVANRTGEPAEPPEEAILENEINVET